MRPMRLRVCFELACALGLFALKGVEVVAAPPAATEDLLLFHTPEYLKVLEEADSGQMPEGGPAHGLGPGDNPVFRGVYRWSRLSAGASLQGARMVLEGRGRLGGPARAFNIAGGLHHAMASRASGFCYVNDAAIAVKWLVDQGARVAYVDMDAHHGDGVQGAFYGTDRVLTISLHETGRSLFPGTGFVDETGGAGGEGYSVNVPLPPGTGDGEFIRAFKAVVPDLVRAFGPDVLVTQLGADTLSTDPLTHLRLSVRGFEEAVRVLRSLGLPWLALGGGGYDMGATARAWSVAWAVMNDAEAELPEEVPAEFLERYPGLFSGPLLRGPEKREGPGQGPDPLLMREVERTTGLVRERILPVLRGR